MTHSSFKSFKYQTRLGPWKEQEAIKEKRRRDNGIEKPITDWGFNDPVADQKKTSEVNTMGRVMHCDLCRTNVPIEENFQEVVIGKVKIAEMCITCGSKLANLVKTQMAEANKAVDAAQAAVPPVPEAPQAPDEPRGTPGPGPVLPSDTSRDGPAAPVAQ